MFIKLNVYENKLRHLKKFSRDSDATGLGYLIGVYVFFPAPLLKPTGWHPCILSSSLGEFYIYQEVLVWSQISFIQSHVIIYKITWFKWHIKCERKLLLWKWTWTLWKDSQRLTDKMRVLLNYMWRDNWKDY